MPEMSPAREEGHERGLGRRAREEQVWNVMLDQMRQCDHLVDVG